MANDPTGVLQALTEHFIHIHSYTEKMPHDCAGWAASDTFKSCPHLTILNAARATYKPEYYSQQEHEWLERHGYEKKQTGKPNAS